MNVRQLTLEEYIHCDELNDGCHTMDGYNVMS